MGKEQEVIPLEERERNYWDLALLTGKGLEGFNVRHWCEFPLCHEFGLFLEFTFPVFLVYFVKDGLKPCRVIPCNIPGIRERGTEEEHLLHLSGEQWAGKPEFL